MVDVIQSRYGWTDEYIFDTLPAERARMIFEIVISQKVEEQRDNMRMQAFNAWLQRPQGKFDDYLAKIGLPYVDPDEVEVTNDVTSEEAYGIAYNILSRFRPDEEGEKEWKNFLS